ncbi:MAG: hypothetical protein ABSB15_25680 [Bryobacteraceae bacterium]|jgi:hypothetical protein
MQFIRRVIHCGFVTFVALGVTAQTPTKPSISSVTVLPSEPPIPSGSCTASKAGYLEKDGKTDISGTETWSMISAYLHDGYVVTVYPQTKRGTFVNLECPPKGSTVPKR